MYTVSLKNLSVLALMFCVLLFSGFGLAEDLSDAKAVCKNLTPDNRSMAKAAGYDLDKLCRSLDSIAPRAASQSPGSSCDHAKNYRVLCKPSNSRGCCCANGGFRQCGRG
jgi:hypothetical protein